MSFTYEEKNTDVQDYQEILTGGEKAHLLKIIIKNNYLKFIFSIIIYIIKASPIYIIPICTSEVINIVSDVINGIGHADYPFLICFYCLVVGFSLIQNIFTHTLYAKITDNMLRTASAGIRESVIRKLQNLSITFHKETDSGIIQSKFLRDIDNTEIYLNNIVKSLIPSLIITLAAIIISICTDYEMTLFFLLVIPINIFVSSLFRKKIVINNRNYRLASETLSKRFTSMIEMIPITKAHGLEENEINDLDQEVKNVRSKGLNVDYAVAIFGSAIWILGNLLSFSCVIFSCWLAIKGKIRIGDIILYQSLFANINGNVQNIINLVPSISSGKESIVSLSEIMSSKDVENKRGRIKLDNFKGKVELDSVCFKYKKSREEVIENFSLLVKPGKFIAFVGPSGSGKTTIMNLIIGLISPDKGQVRIDDVNLNDLSLKDYRHHLAVVSQKAILFKGTIKENLTYGLDKYSDDEIRKALDISNCNDFISSLPGGINYVLEESGDNLSGGQKQRITIARALLRNPSIVIFDEATSALDNISELQVQKAIRNSIRGRTTFIVAHRLSTIMSADQIIYMEKGRIIEKGTYSELIDMKGKFFTMAKIFQKGEEK